MVRINDRGPFIKDRIIDLSYKAARELGSYDEGVAPVTLRIVKPGRLNTPTDTTYTLEKEVVTETEASRKKIEPPPTTETVPETTPETTPETNYMDDIHVKYYLQAGAFGVKENAEKMLRNIKLILPDMPFNIKSEDGLYKVLSGPLPTREKAEELKKILLDIDIDAFIKEL
jgi:rare lipoprotein A